MATVKRKLIQPTWTSEWFELEEITFCCEKLQDEFEHPQPETVHETDSLISASSTFDTTISFLPHRGTIGIEQDVRYGVAFEYCPFCQTPVTVETVAAFNADRETVTEEVERQVKRREETSIPDRVK